MAVPENISIIGVVLLPRCVLFEEGHDAHLCSDRREQQLSRLLLALPVPVVPGQFLFLFHFLAEFFDFVLHLGVFLTDPFL